MASMEASLTERSGAASRMRSAAQDLRQAVARLEQVLLEREARNEALAQGGNAEAALIADQLEAVAADLERIGAQADADHA